MSADIVDLTEYRDVRSVSTWGRTNPAWRSLTKWADTSKNEALAEAVRRLRELPAEKYANLITAASFGIASREDTDRVGRQLLAILDGEGGDA